MRALLVFPILSVALLACPPKESTTPGQPPERQPATQPATKPATPPAGSSTTSMKGSDPMERDQIDPDGVVRRGAQLSGAAALSVSEVLAQADALAGKSVKVTGMVDKVCQKKGCWFVVKEGDETIRITAKGYGFFVPSKSPGMTATIEGELSVKMLDEAAAKHYEAEGAAPASMKEVAIAAAALEMKQNG